MTTLVEKIVTISQQLDRHRIMHAFGGALALAWCTERARGTVDIDVNVFVGTDLVDTALGSFLPAVGHRAEDRLALERDGQVRLWWESTPIDVFLSTTEFHEQAALRVRRFPFGGRAIPFLACDDLAVFKAFFNRTKDWADLEEMAQAKSIDIEKVIGVLVHYLGPDDDRIRRLLRLL